MSTGQTRWGATAEEWAHFDLVLGLGSDLLPVVSNPSAVVSPGSTLKALGKVPSSYNRAGQVIGFPKWTEHLTMGPELARWPAVADYGICLQTRNIRGLDIDIADEAKAERAARYFEKVLGFAQGALPRRVRSNSGKRLLAFECAGPVRKRSFKCDGGLVELLGDGQQMVVAGCHPSGVRYEWLGGLPMAFPAIARGVAVTL